MSNVNVTASAFGGGPITYAASVDVCGVVVRTSNHRAPLDAVRALRERLRDAVNAASREEMQIMRDRSGS